MKRNLSDTATIERPLELEDCLLPVAGWFIAVFEDVRIRYILCLGSGSFY
jgi:hypothetical protein